MANSTVLEPVVSELTQSAGSGTATKMALAPEAPAMAPVRNTPPEPARDFHLNGLPGEGEWGSLSFQHSREQERAPDSDIYTHDHVAPLTARLMAGFYDALLISFGCGLMIGTHVLMTRSYEESALPQSAMGWTIYAVLILVVIAFYRGLFILGGCDSPGTQWAGLRLVTFDGDPPTKHERFMRMAWSAFSTLPLGLGLLWAFVDQERLTWHDLLSKTFPSPDDKTRSLPGWSR